MIFQVMDDKRECFAIYAEGQFYYEDFPKKLSHTWNYNEKLSEKDITYFYLWVQGKNITDVCPEHLKIGMKPQKRK